MVPIGYPGLAGFLEEPWRSYVWSWTCRVLSSYHSFRMPVTSVAFYFAASVPQVFLPDLDGILTVEQVRNIVVGDVTLFLSLMFYLLPEGNKANHEYKGPKGTPFKSYPGFLYPYNHFAHCIPVRSWHTYQIGGSLLWGRITTVISGDRLPYGIILGQRILPSPIGINQTLIQCHSRLLNHHYVQCGVHAAAKGFTKFTLLMSSNSYPSSLPTSGFFPFHWLLHLQFIASTSLCHSHKLKEKLEFQSYITIRA